MIHKHFKTAPFLKKNKTIHIQTGGNEQGKKITYLKHKQTKGKTQLDSHSLPFLL